MATVTHTTSPTSGNVLHVVRNAVAVIAGVFLIMHGVAHSLAFFTQWQITHPKGINYVTTLLYGKIDIGDVGIRVDGLLWLVAAAVFVIVGLRLAWLRKMEVRPVLAITLFSLVLCVLGLPQAIVGVRINAAILVGLIALMIFAHRQIAR